MLNKFKQLADANTPPIPEVQPGQEIPPMPLVPAMVQKHGAVYWCLFEVDFSESQDRVSDRFLEWLKRQEHKTQRTSKTGKILRAQKVRRHWNSIYYCLFEVDLSAGQGALTKQFKKWLASPENRKRLRRYVKEKRGATGQSLDRLKDLAAWRLYRENGNNCEQANLFANQNRKKFKDWPEIFRTCKKKNGKWPYKPGDFRPFHNAKTTGDDLLNNAPLFSASDDYRHAKMRAMERLADSYPREFKKPSPAMEKVFQELRKLAQKRQ